MVVCNSVTPWTEPTRLLCPHNLQARVLEWLPLPSPGDLPDPRNLTQVSSIAVWATWEVTYIHTHTVLYVYIYTQRERHSYICNTLQCIVYVCVYVCVYGIGTGKERDKKDRQRPREEGQMVHGGQTPEKWAYSNHTPHRIRAGCDQQKHRLLCGNILTSEAFMTSSKSHEVVMHFHRTEE